MGGLGLLNPAVEAETAHTTPCEVTKPLVDRLLGRTKCPMAEVFPIRTQLQLNHGEPNPVSWKIDQHLLKIACLTRCSAPFWLPKSRVCCRCICWVSGEIQKDVCVVWKWWVCEDLKEVSKIGFSSATCLSSFLYFRIYLSRSHSESRVVFWAIGNIWRPCGFHGGRRRQRKGHCADVASKTHQCQERNRLFGSRVTNIRERSARPTTRRTTIGAGSEERRCGTRSEERASITISQEKGRRTRSQERGSART